MNVKGRNYLDAVKLFFNQVDKTDWAEPTDHEIAERIMRIGEEVRVFELEPLTEKSSQEVHGEYRTIAIATMKEDYILRRANRQ